MGQEIMVSVFCLAYNHEKYIRDALEGFVMQRTNFKFEVLVHDDASTDGTADIIREYERNYPDIIKPIYQAENQYSLRAGITKTFLLPVAKGKYFAWCEGDDYWTDPDKLQKQVDFMETHPEHSICVHRAVKHWCTPGGEDTIIPEQGHSRDYSAKEIMSREVPFAMASFMIRAELHRKMPDCFRARTCGDIPLQIYTSICGKFHCLQDIMSVYNYRSESSFTKGFFHDHSKKIEHNIDVIEMLHRVDEYYNGQYTEELAAGIRYHEYHLYKHTGELEKISGKEYDKARDLDEQRIARLKELEEQIE